MIRSDPQCPAKPSPRRVLLVNPRFNGDSFWSYRKSCELVGAKYPAPSLGLLTIAAMLPPHWEIRFFDRNIENDEIAFDHHLDWADLLMSGGMLPQQIDHLRIISLARSRSLPIAVGGPDVSSSPQIYSEANFRIVGEAEGVIDSYIAAIERGVEEDEFVAEPFSVDVTASPIPRFDLIDFDDYAEITVQFSRGCPFRCEFCDIIELYGRRPRTKTPKQMIAELNRLYELGYRGTVEFSDDNLIGNKKAVKLFLRELIPWQQARGYPFEFATEATLNLSDDDELLSLLRSANFFALFVGVETPDPEVLRSIQKTQNSRRDLVESVRKIQSAGMFVAGGFIVGFDSERKSVARAMVDFIEEAAIPVCMVGLLYALPNTQLTRRLAREHRLHPANGRVVDMGDTDQMTAGLNFDTVRPRSEILRDFSQIISAVYNEPAYFARIARAVALIDTSGPSGALNRATLVKNLRILVKFVWATRPGWKGVHNQVWKLLARVVLRNPRALRQAIIMSCFYAHVGSFARTVVERAEREIAALNEERAYGSVTQIADGRLARART